MLDPTVDCLVVLEEGTVGGAMDVLFDPTVDRVAVVETVRVCDGVPVRDVVLADAAPEVSCFVGDFAGD